METVTLINGCYSLGRVLVVPFQKLSLKGTLVKFCPNFSAFSVDSGEDEVNNKSVNKR